MLTNNGIICIKFSYHEESDLEDYILQKLEGLYSGKVSKTLKDHDRGSVVAIFHSTKKVIEVRIKVYTTKDRFNNLSDLVEEIDTIEMSTRHRLSRISISKQFYDIDRSISSIKESLTECSTIPESPLMTNRQFWIKLFSENDVALIAAINSVQRGTPSEYRPLNDSEIEFIMKQKQWLNEPADKSVVEKVFGKLDTEIRGIYIVTNDAIRFNCCNKSIKINVFDADKSETNKQFIRCPFCGREISYRSKSDE